MVLQHAMHVVTVDLYYGFAARDACCNIDDVYCNIKGVSNYTLAITTGPPLTTRSVRKVSALAYPSG